jgi:hypothetical protein
MAQGWWERASALIQERGEVIQGAAGRLVHAIKENPVPFAIVGAAGAGVLAYSLFQRQSGYTDESTEEEQSATVESLKEKVGYAVR